MSAAEAVGEGEEGEDWRRRLLLRPREQMDPEDVVSITAILTWQVREMFACWASPFCS